MKDATVKQVALVGDFSPICLTTKHKEDLYAIVFKLSCAQTHTHTSVECVVHVFMIIVMTI